MQQNGANPAEQFAELYAFDEVLQARVPKLFETSVEEAGATAPRSRTAAALVLRAATQEAMIAAIAADRSGGNSWEDVGADLGVTRSTVHGRFAESTRQLRDQLTVRLGRAATQADFSDYANRTWQAVHEITGQKLQHVTPTASPPAPPRVPALPPYTTTARDELKDLHQKVDRLLYLFEPHKD